MKFSERWLKSWVPDGAEISTEELCEQLTNAGLEVDGVESVHPGFSGVVVADVTSIEPHPQAPALSVCRVAAGDEAVEVVCGAPNVRVGMKAAFAPVGSLLPDGTRIECAERSGVASEGMLLSEAELDLGNDDSGLLELPTTLPAGQDLAATLTLDEDNCIDLDLTPNRGDCLSIRGLAREVGLLNNVPVSPPKFEPSPESTGTSFPITVENAAGCPRYLGRVIEDVDVSARAPMWMRERLRRCGLRSIDPVVDVTNYVLLELGQPMHAFDLAQLHGGIVVRDGRPGESIVLLDGREIAVEDTTLLICDGNGPVAIAGVMGGERSGVSRATRNVFLECAFFAPQTVAATARRFGLHTDAAHRYERGVDYELQAEAVERATGLLLDIVGGKAGPVVAAGSDDHLPKRSPVSLRRSRLQHLVGEAVADAEVTRIFERLEMKPVASGDGEKRTWRVTPPSHRFDIELEEDLVEEVLRIHGYNTVASRVPAASLPLGQPARDKLPASKLADLLVDLGYSEAITYSFIDPKVADILDPQADPLRVVNPISNDHAAMRTNLLAGLVAALGNNLARQASRLRLFEIGQCFQRHADDLTQATWCGGILFGNREQESWAQDESALDFFDVKGDVERLLAQGGRDATFAPAGDPILHPGQSATAFLDGDEVGRLGRLHPEVEAALGLPAGVFVFELNVDAISQLRIRRDDGQSRFPSVRRDLALVVEQKVDAASIQAVARRCLGELLAEFRVFDVYVGKGIADGSKSVAIGMTLQHPSRTLADAEVQDRIAELVAALGAELGARLR